jgi:predicted nucleotidyltransferase
MKTREVLPIAKLPELTEQVIEHPYPLLFATISGAHIYGFPSRNSDFDLRGAHCLPLDEILGLRVRHETVEKDSVRNGLEIDLVTHDIGKFFGMMLKRNGYVLEQLMSPLVVFSTPEFQELRELGPECLTRYHAYHYLGFADTQWKLYANETPPRVKPLLYVYRVLWTGIHLMRTGELNTNLDELNEIYPHSYISELIDRKCHGQEKETISDDSVPFHAAEYARLVQRLREEFQATRLPEMPACEARLNDLLIRIRKNAG